MIDYMHSYTKLRTGEQDFHEFMRLVNAVYEYGYNKGKVDALKQATDYFNEQCANLG